MNPTRPRNRLTAGSRRATGSRAPSERAHVAALADVATSYLQGFADAELDGNTLGAAVSDYTLRYEGGATAATPILRRFAIQQSRIGWGASAFAALPAREEQVVRSSSEQLAADGAVRQPFGLGECRVLGARDSRDNDLLWIYALPNPHPEQPIESVVLTPRDERSAVYAITLTDVAEHPLRPGVRRRVRLDMPAGAALNAIGELDDVAVDLGTVISARAVLEYDDERWLGGEPSPRSPNSRSSSTTWRTRPPGSTSGSATSRRSTSSQRGSRASRLCRRRTGRSACGSSRRG